MHHVKEIENQFAILQRKRIKRGLINGLGSIIKFITGNPDNDDLKLINTQTNTLTKNTNSLFKQQESFTVFANDINNRLNSTVKQFNLNLMFIKLTLNHLEKGLSDLTYTIIYLNQIEQLSNFLSKLILTISLSRSNIVNNEFFDVEEIHKIESQLKTLYHEDQLLSAIDHPYELLEHSNIITYVQNNVLKIILKIPILKRETHSLYQIFAVPRTDGTMLLTPAEFYSNENWFSKCNIHKHNNYVCTDQKMTQCNLSTQLTSCLYIIMTQPKEFTKTTLNSITVTNRDPKHFGCTSINKCITYLISQNCSSTNLPYKMPQLYLPELPRNFKLKLEEIKVPKGHHLEPIPLQEVPTHLKISWITQALIIVFIIIVIGLIIYKRHHLKMLLMKPRHTLESLASLLRREELSNPTSTAS